MSYDDHPYARGRVLKALLTAIIASLTAMVVFAAPAKAELSQVGPVDPSNGYPYWYEDTEGVRLDLCLDPQDQMCLQPFEMPEPNAPVSFPENFPGEAFWWAGETSMTLANGADASLVMAQEAAFANDQVVDGDQVSFGRIRIRVDGLDAGQRYRVIHPYGADEFVAEPVVDGSSQGQINFTEDVGCLMPTPQNPCRFGQEGYIDESLSSRIGPFLRWDVGAPEGYLGDPGVPHTVTGSPNGTNFFRVERLNDDGSVAEVLGETDRFTISGKVATPQVDAAPRREIFNAPQDVTLVPSDSSYEVYYTDDGTDPSDPANASRRLYGAPIHLEGAEGEVRITTLRFVAVDPVTGDSSPVMEKSYTIDRQAPNLDANPPAGIYETAQTVALSTGDAADSIYYTTDGSEPKVEVTRDPNTGTTVNVLNGERYTSPVEIGRSQTIKAIAIDEAGNQSQVQTYRYTIASLAARGPHNPATGSDPNGFPFWYEDSNGVKLDLCLDPQDQMCLQPFEMPEPNAPVSFPENFPGEAFWWAGETSMTLANGADASLVMAQEAAFANEAVRDGEQASFGRVRVRIDSLEVGQEYRVSHPYGTDTFIAEDDGQGGGEINATEDIGCFGTATTPCDYDAARFSGVGPFLTWDTFGRSEAEGGPPAGYVGDPNLEGGHKVKGSPVTDASGNPQNYFKVERLNADGTVTQIGLTDMFNISGKVATLQVAASKAGGSYSAPQDVLLRASEPNATIYYTTDGSEPTVGGPNRLEGEGTVTVSDTTLKYMAVDEAGNQSQVYTETYTIDTVAPTVSADPQSGSYNAPQDVALVASEPAKIYYTKGPRGSEVPNPTEESTLYSSPIRVEASTTIKAITVDRADNRSEVAAFDYDIEASPPAPPSDPVQNLRAFDQLAVKSPLATSTLPVTIEWGASQNGTVTSYQLQQSANGGQFADVANQPGTATSATLDLPMGLVTSPNLYQLRVRACNGPSCSAWATGPMFTLLPVDDSTVDSGFLARISYGGKWSSERLAGAYGGSVRHASTEKEEAELNKMTFTVNGNFAWISTFGPDRGLAAVSVDDGPAQIVDLYSPTVQTARVAFAANNLAAGTEHEITVQVLGDRNPASTGTRVDLDAFIAIF